MELSDVAESSIRPPKVNDQILANLKSTGKWINIQLIDYNESSVKLGQLLNNFTDGPYDL